MTNELVREKIFLDQRVGRESTQILLEGDIIVPDTRPDMALVLQTESKINIDRLDVSTDRIGFGGSLWVSVLYISKTSEKSVHTMTVSAPVDDFLNMDGVSKENWVRTKAEIVNIEYKMLNDRKLNYKAVVNVTAEAERLDVHEMVVHIHDLPENQMLKGKINVNRSIEHKNERFSVKEQVLLPSAKPNIREVLQTGASITSQDSKVEQGRIVVTGEILLSTLYRGESDGSSLIELLENELPFRAEIEVSDATEAMFADTALTILDEYVQIRQDADGEDRELEVDITVGISLKVYSTEGLQVLEDAYSINRRLDFANARLKYPHLVCRNRNQAGIKELVQLPDSAPDMLQIFKVRGNARLDEIKIADDKLIAEGVIDTDILYVAESDTMPLYSHKTVIPYRQVIDAKGATPDMQAAIEISASHASFNMLSGRETEIRFQLSFNAQVTEETEITVINNIEFNELEPEVLENQASMTIYIVQNDDNLWSVAKRYNTPIDELISVNELEDKQIHTGQKLLILKKVA